MVAYVSSKLPIDSDYRLWIHKNHQAYEHLSDSTCQVISDYRIAKSNIPDLIQAASGGNDRRIIAITRDGTLVTWAPESADTFTNSDITNAKLIVDVLHVLCFDATVHRSLLPFFNRWVLIRSNVINLSSVGSDVNMLRKPHIHLKDSPILCGHRNVVYANGRIIHHHSDGGYSSWKPSNIDPKSIVDIANYQDTDIVLVIIGMGQLATVKSIADVIPIERVMFDNDDVVSQFSFKRFIILDGIVRIEDTNGHVYDCTLKDNEATLSRLNTLPCKILYEGGVSRRLAYTKSARNNA